jgi:hypothetical protein
MSRKTQQTSATRPAIVTIPELEQSKTAVLNSLASRHSRRSYQSAIDRFIAWYCSEPRPTFNRSVVVSYRSFLERLSLSAATINLQLSAIRRLADESAESGWLSPELAIGIRRVKGVKRLGRKMGNWLVTLRHSTVRIVYLLSGSDRLLGTRGLRGFLAARPDVETVKIDGPHFLLQCAPGSSLAGLLKIGILGDSGKPQTQ